MQRNPLKKFFIIFPLIGLLLGATLLINCKKKDVFPPADLQGSKGQLRFYLKIGDSDTADLDLHVITPKGNEISYSATSKDGGQYEFDCRCAECPNGGWENIYWAEGDNTSPPSGVYTYWIDYYNFCTQEGGESEFTVYCIKDGRLRQTYSGRLGFGQQSDQYTFLLD